MKDEYAEALIALTRAVANARQVGMSRADVEGQVSDTLDDADE